LAPVAEVPEELAEASDGRLDIAGRAVVEAAVPPARLLATLPARPAAVAGAGAVEAAPELLGPVRGGRVVVVVPIGFLTGVAPVPMGRAVAVVVATALVVAAADGLLAAVTEDMGGFELEDEGATDERPAVVVPPARAGAAAVGPVARVAPGATEGRGATLAAPPVAEPTVLIRRATAGGLVPAVVALVVLVVVSGF
jgi:hypothetical protein